VSARNGGKTSLRLGNNLAKPRAMWGFSFYLLALSDRPEKVDAISKMILTGGIKWNGYRKRMRVDSKHANLPTHFSTHGLLRFGKVA
jgi:hypothetical protein